jgi:hypothetical protein
MTSQEQINHPAAGAEPGNELSDQAGAPRADFQVGMPFDYIDEAIEESMDASDPPALTPETTIGPPGRDATRAGGPGRRD